MTWGIVSVGVGTAASIYGGNKARNSSIKQMNDASNAENAAIAKQNMNQIVRNSYRAGLANLQLGLSKKQATQSGFDLSAAGAMALGNASTAAAASGSVGASVDAVQSDIQMKIDQAATAQADEYEQMIDNFNLELEANRMNALETTLEARQYKYRGASQGDIITGAVLSSAVQWAGNYALRKASLGLGPAVPSQTKPLF